MTRRQISFSAIGTHWQVQTTDSLSDIDWATLTDSILARIERFDVTYSRFRADSLISRMSQRAGRYELPADGYALLEFYKKLYRVTYGKVTPLIGQVMVDAGYDAQYSFQAQSLSTVPRWEDVLDYTSDSITVSRPSLLDFGAAGKGYLVDIIGTMMQSAGLSDYVVNAGGDMLHRGQQSQKFEVGLENPFDTSEAIGIVGLDNQSLCASATTKRHWGEFHHVIDPTVLQSTDSITASWVIAHDTMTADGLATALFFTPAATLARHFEFSYAMLDDQGGLRYSPNFPVKLFQAV